MNGLRCSCGRFLKIEAKGTMIAEITCPDRKCKKTNQVKIVNSQSSTSDIKYKFNELV